jgi:hypothetical protein
VTFHRLTSVALLTVTTVLCADLVGVAVAQPQLTSARKRKIKRKLIPVDSLSTTTAAVDEPRFVFQLQSGQPGFSQLLPEAQVVSNIDDAVWALVHACNGTDTLEQRQCRAVRDARIKAWTSKVLLITPDPGAFVFSDWDPKAKSIVWSLQACIRCSGVTVDGAKYEVLADRIVPGVPTQTPSQINSSSIVVPTIAGDTRVFRNALSADNWLQRAKRASVSLLVRASSQSVWHDGTRQGVSFDVVGYRIWDRCDGFVIAASEQTNPNGDSFISAQPDKSQCK